jgi:hypothetical protein
VCIGDADFSILPGGTRFFVLRLAFALPKRADQNLADALSAMFDASAKVVELRPQTAIQSQDF